MTANDGGWFVLVLTLNLPFRLAEKHRMIRGRRDMLFERKRVHIPPVHSSIAGNPQGGHVGYPFFW